MCSLPRAVRDSTTSLVMGTSRVAADDKSFFDQLRL